MRDSVKVTMVLESSSNAKHFPASFRSRSHLLNQSVGSNPMFHTDKLRAMKIFKKTETSRN
jgi:hypothetical protein